MELEELRGLTNVGKCREMEMEECKDCKWRNVLRDRG